MLPPYAYNTGEEFIQNLIMQEPSKKSATPPPPPPRQNASGLSRDDLKIAESVLGKLDAITEELIMVRKEIVSTRVQIPEKVSQGVLRAAFALFLISIALIIFFGILMALNHH